MSTFSQQLRDYLDERLKNSGGKQNDKNADELNFRRFNLDADDIETDVKDPDTNLQGDVNFLSRITTLIKSLDDDPSVGELAEITTIFNAATANKQVDNQFKSTKLQLDNIKTLYEDDIAETAKENEAERKFKASQSKQQLGFDLLTLEKKNSLDNRELDLKADLFERGYSEKRHEFDVNARVADKQSDQTFTIQQQGIEDAYTLASRKQHLDERKSDQSYSLARTDRTLEGKRIDNKLLLDSRALDLRSRTIASVLGDDSISESSSVTDSILRERNMNRAIDNAKKDLDKLPKANPTTTTDDVKKSLNGKLSVNKRKNFFEPEGGLKFQDVFDDSNKLTQDAIGGTGKFRVEKSEDSIKQLRGDIDKVNRAAFALSEATKELPSYTTEDEPVEDDDHNTDNRGKTVTPDTKPPPKGNNPGGSTNNSDVNNKKGANNAIKNNPNATTDDINEIMNRTSTIPEKTPSNNPNDNTEAINNIDRIFDN